MRLPCRTACVTVALLLTTTIGAAQRPYLQLGGGAGLGAYTTDGSPSDHGLFPAGAFALGLEWPQVFVRADARAFDTEFEPLLTVGLAVGVPLLRSERGRLYVLGGAGAGYFVEEGDPGHPVGIGIGVTTSRLLGLYAELRYDYLLGTFTYDARRRSLASLVAGIRVGPADPDGRLSQRCMMPARAATCDRLPRP